HGDPHDRDVLHASAIHGLEREAAAALEDAVGHRNVLEAAVRFRAALDAAGALPATVLRSIGKRFEAAVEQRADLIAAGDQAIGDGDILGCTRMAEGKRALQADRVVPGRIYAAVDDADIATAIDVDTVAVGVDLQIVDRHVVDPRRQNGE